MAIRRRAVLGIGAASAASVALGSGAWGEIDRAFGRPALQLDYPFTLGVASGDPGLESLVLWTRLAVDPLAPDGRGGMPNAPVEVQYAVATDPGFVNRVRKSSVWATPELAHSVHVGITGLDPDTEYWYRFHVKNVGTSPVGRTRTFAPWSTTPQVRFGVASCQSYEGGLYTAYQHLAQEDLDFVLHLGDYIYEKSYVADPQFHGGGALPAHLRTECFDLARYRTQYGLYKSDPHLQAAHARFPFIHTFDDHEVENDYADDISESDGEPDNDPAVFRQRRAAAYQAAYENLPLRRDQIPVGPDMLMHRRRRISGQIDMFVLDSRQYRDADACQSATNCQERFDPDRSMLGGTQRQWLLDSMTSSQARWQVLANQMPMAFIDRDPDPADTQVFTESWDGFVAERNTLLGTAHDEGVDNLVVLTGDRHSNYAVDLKADYEDPNSPVVASELVGTSISSGGDGADMLPNGQIYLDTNDHLKFCNFQRGYLRCTATTEEFRTDFRVLQRVSVAGEPISTRATYVVEDGSPGVVAD